MPNCEIHFRGKPIAKAKAQAWELDGAIGLMLRGKDADRDSLETAFLEENETVTLMRNKKSIEMNLAMLLYPNDDSFEAFLIKPHVTFDND